VASCGRMLILSWSAELSLCSNWNQLRRRNRTKVAEPASENVMPDWDAKIRQGLTHASLLSLATAFRPDHIAKLPAPAASMTMPAKHSASKLIPWRIRLAKRHPGIARAVPKSI